MNWRALRIGPLLASTRADAAADVRPGVNLTEQIRAAVTHEMLAAIPRNKRIVVNATQPVKHRVTVFTIPIAPGRRFHQRSRTICEQASRFGTFLPS
jgi:hypothetical protein